MLAVGNNPEHRGSVDTAAGFNYIDLRHPIPKSGVAQKWEFFAGAIGTVDLCVWRPVALNSLDHANAFEKVLQKTVTVSEAPKVVSVNLDNDPSWKVEKGDYIGWSDHGTGVITFDFVASQHVRWQSGSSSPMNFDFYGNQYHEQAGLVIGSRAYSARLCFDPNERALSWLEFPTENSARFVGGQPKTTVFEFKLSEDLAGSLGAVIVRASPRDGGDSFGTVRIKGEGFEQEIGRWNPGSFGSVHCGDRTSCVYPVGTHPLYFPFSLPKGLRQPLRVEFCQNDGPPGLLIHEAMLSVSHPEVGRRFENGEAGFRLAVRKLPLEKSIAVFLMHPPTSDGRSFAACMRLGVSSVVPHYRNVFLWGGNDSERAPALWICPGKRAFHFSMRGGASPELFNQWNDIGEEVVSAALEEGGHFAFCVSDKIVRVFVNGSLVFSRELPSQPQFLDSRPFFIGAPWWRCDGIEVTDFRVTLTNVTEIDVRRLKEDAELLEGGELDNVHGGLQESKVVENPQMTADDDAGIRASASSSYPDGDNFKPFRAFNKDLNWPPWESAPSELPQWLQLEYPEPVSLRQYSLSDHADPSCGRADDGSRLSPRMPRVWEVICSMDGQSWTAIHSVSDQSPFGPSVTRSFPVAVANRARIFRLVVGDVFDRADKLVYIGQWRLFTEYPQNETASSGINMRTHELLKRYVLKCAAERSTIACNVASCRAGERYTANLNLYTHVKLSDVWDILSSAITAELTPISAVDQREPVHAEFVAVPDAGGMLLTFAPTAPGSYELRVQFGGYLLTDSVVLVSVVPGPAHGPTSRVAEEPSTPVVAGSSVSWVIETRDSFGNRCVNDGDAADMVAIGMADAEGNQLVPEYSVACLGEGCYRLTASMFVSGLFGVALFVNGGAVDGMGEDPHPMEIVAGPVCVPKCFGIGDLPLPAKVLRPTAFTIQAVDAFGNRLAEGGTDVLFKASLLGPNCKAVVMDRLPVTGMGDGTYQVCVESRPSRVVLPSCLRCE